MSPRAAWRLELLGFEAHDYAAGKADWLAAGRPTEGPGPGARRALAAADRDVLTCGPDEDIGDVARRVRAAGRDGCVVVTEGGVVLGLLRGHTLDHEDDDRPAVEVMQEGPTTVRADEDLGPLLDRMARAGARQVLVTTPEGELLGVVRREATA